MSNPANNLAKFRSYTYYHVLAMCDSSATADLLSKDDNSLDIWNHATNLTRIQDLNDLGPYSPKCIGGTGKYAILINGSTDAAFAITTAKWQSMTGGSARPGDQNTSITIDGSLTVSEPKGIAFLDQVVKCSVALGVDSSQVVYVLKTFFVGHLDDLEGTSAQSQYITDIPPLHFIVVDVTGTFTEAGGVYEMQFVAIAHGAARLPQYSKAVTSINITAGTSLADTMKRLESAINTSYADYYKTVLDQVASVNGVDTADLVDSLRPVKYVIEVGTDYQDPRYTVTDQPSQQKNNGSCDAPAQLSFPTPTNIEDAIDQIMLMSKQVKADMASGDPSNKVKYEYKIHTAVVSTPAGGVSAGSAPNCNDSQQFDYTVYYRVERFATPRTIALDAQMNAAASDTEDTADPAFAALKRNLIEFNYMYTGENIDILEFDMKLNYGLAYLQIASLANTFKNQVERAAAKQTLVSTHDINVIPSRLGGNNVQTPIFFGSQIKIPKFTGTQDTSSTIQSAYTLSKHASIELAEASMRIIGNDQLLRMTNRTSSAGFVTSDSKKIYADEANADTAPTDQFNDWSKVPAFAKVKIMMPRNNDDIALFTGQTVGRDDAGLDYAREFWFDGYYYIMSVDHEFTDGLFTQKLDMLAIPKKSAFTESKTIDVKDYTPKQNLPSSYDNKIDSVPAGGKINPPFVRPGSNGQPTTRADAKAIASSNNTLDSVPGWKKASPEVQTAILNASKQYGVDPVVLARMAAKESSFNPSARAPAGTATGLFQFINETWLTRVKADPSIGVNSNQSTTNLLAARYDVQANANAGASLLKANSTAIGSSDPGDIYLAHFAGAGVARPIIEADMAGKGNTTVKDLISSMRGGASLYATMKKNNPTIINDNTTVSQLRTWSARAMGESEPNNTLVAKENRKASTALASVQDSTVQTSKANTDPCGNTPNDKG